MRRALSSIRSELDACLAASESASPSAQLDEIEQCLQQIARDAECSFEARALRQQDEAFTCEVGRETAKNNQLLSPNEALALAQACGRMLDRVRVVGEDATPPAGEEEDMCVN